MNFIDINNSSTLIPIPTPVGVYVGAINSNTVASNYLSLNDGGTINANVNTVSLFTNKIGIGTISTASNLYVAGNCNTTIMGNVGIGTIDTNSYKLHVQGDTNLNGNAYIRNSIFQDNYDKSNIFLGNIGIGTANTSTYKLNVNGILNASTIYNNNIDISSIYTTNDTIYNQTLTILPPPLYPQYDYNILLPYIDLTTVPRITSNVIYNCIPITYIYEAIIYNKAVKGTYNIYSSVNDATLDYYGRHIMFSGLEYYPYTSYSMWESNKYNSNGYYIGNSYIKDSNFKGEWVIIQFPEKIILSEFYIENLIDSIYAPNIVQCVPVLWKCYGSNDGINWVEIIEASNTTTDAVYINTTRTYTTLNGYNSNFDIYITIKTLNSSFIKPYSYIGWTFNKILGGSVGNRLIISRITLFCKEKIKNSSISLWDIDTNYSNIYSYLPANINIGTSTPANYKLHVQGDTNLNGNVFIRNSIFQDNYDKSNIFLGYVAIGTANPTTALTINGTCTATSFVGIGSDITNINYVNISNKPDNFPTDWSTISNKPSIYNTTQIDSLLTNKEAILSFSSPLIRTGNNITFDNSILFDNANYILKDGTTPMTGQLKLDNSLATSLLYLTSTSTTASNSIEIKNNATTRAFIGVGGTNLGGIYQNNFYIECNGTSIIFNTSNNTTTAPSMMINSNGYVAIGTENPTTALTINGTCTATSFVGNTIAADASLLNNFKLENQNNYIFPPVAIPSGNTITLTNNVPQNGIYIASDSIDSSNTYIAFNIGATSTEFAIDGAYSGGNYINNKSTFITDLTSNGSNYSGEWIQLYYDKGFAASSYIITGSTNINCPKDFILVGSIDASNWVLLSSQVGIDNYSSMLPKPFKIYNFTSYNYYRLIVNKVVSGSSLNILELSFTGTLNTTFANNDKFNNVIYNTSEVKFPPIYITMNSQTVNSNEIFNISPLLNYYKNTYSNATTGKIYTIYSSSSGNKTKIFNRDKSSSSTVLWAANQYSNGLYIDSINNSIGSTKGDWLIIRFDYPTVLTKFTIWNNVQIGNSPKKWICYGSDNGRIWNQIPEASEINGAIYTSDGDITPSYFYTKTLLNNFNIPYLYIGWVFTELTSNTSSQLIFTELEIFIKKNIGNAYIDTWKKDINYDVNENSIYTTKNVYICSQGLQPSSNVINTYKFQVNGDMNIINTTTNIPRLIIGSDSSSNCYLTFNKNVLYAYDFFIDTDNTFNLQRRNLISPYNTNTIFKTNSNLLSNFMNVNIGDNITKTTQTYKLNIDGNMCIKSINSTSCNSIVIQNSSNSNAYIGIGGSGTTGNYSNNFFIQSDTKIILNAGGNESLSTPHMLINNSGNVGIGITIPTSNLTVAGNALITGTIAADASLLNNFKLENQSNYIFPPVAIPSGNTITLTNNVPQNGTYISTDSTNSTSTSTSFNAFDKSTSTEFTINSAYSTGTGNYLNTGSFNKSTYITSNIAPSYIGGFNYLGEWIQLQYNKGFAATSYTITGSTSANCPKDFILAGSIDTNSWILLSSQVGISNYSVSSPKTFSLYNFTSYNYYRLIVNKVVSGTNLSIAELSFTGTLNTSFTNNDNFNILLYNTNEKQFPPRNPDLVTPADDNQTVSNEIFNITPSTCYKQTLTVNNDGNYILYSSSKYYTSSGIPKNKLFNHNLGDGGAYWGYNNYSRPDGNYNIVSFNSRIGTESYFGDWIIIKFPYKIVLTRFRFYRANYVSQAPGLWKCYGSNDGVNWTEIIDASNTETKLISADYTNWFYEKILPTYFDIPYLFIGWVVSNLVGNDSMNADTLNFNELQIFGKDDISNSYLNVWNKRNLNIYNTLGNVGIGTTNPIAKLHITETNGTVATANTGTIILDHENSGGASSIIFRSKTDRGSDYAYIQYQDDATIDGVNQSSKLIIGTQNDASVINGNIDDILLLPSGNVGIGTDTIPIGKLYVNGEIYCTSDITAYYSDIRLKNITSNVDNAMNIINNLTGFYYTANDLAKSFGFKNKRQEVGLSAQEVKKVLPEIVKIAPFDIETDENNEIKSKSGENYLTINYERIVPILVEGMKELYKEINNLKEIINNQKRI